MNFRLLQNVNYISQYKTLYLKRFILKYGKNSMINLMEL